MSLISICQIVAFGLSSACWLAAGLIPTPLPMAYLSAPPDHVVKKIKWQSRLNSAAAISAAIGVGLQGYQDWGTSISN